MDLKYCAACMHVFNALYDATLAHYTPVYDNSLHFSPHFSQYATELAERLVDRYGLHGKTVVEIGCGKGDFLRELCEQGDCRGWGFDRSFDPDRVAEGPSSRINFVQDLYTAEYADRLHPDFVCCRHVLEHVADPRIFLDNIRQGFGDRTDAVLYFEVPNALFTLKDMGIWDLIYEHCGYFTLSSLTKAMTSSGFDVLGMGETFGGQFIFIEMRPGIGRVHADLPETHDPPAVGRYAAQFAGQYHEKLRFWRQRLGDLKQAKRTAVVWGGGSKGVTFLNVLGDTSGIDYVVDLNPHKQGKYVAGTGQLVVSPEFLHRFCPTDVIVMNPIYMKEIANLVQGLGLDVSLHCV
jgi:SAM-dependent methyltransferase